ncbi:hypothetical protein, partial [Brevibacillus sp. SIMBA_040]
CYSILQKEVLCIFDVIKLNQIVFTTENLEISLFNQKLRAYDKATILYILEYQKKNKYTNIALAHKFKLSRNSIARWEKMFDK